MVVGFSLAAIQYQVTAMTTQKKQILVAYQFWSIS